MNLRLLLGLICLSFTALGHAQDGAPDTSFSGDGIVSAVSGAGFQAAFTVVALPDGAVLAGGVMQTGSNFDLQVIRYRANGGIDGSWSNSGGLTLPIDRVTDGWDEVLAIAPLDSGAVTLLGSAEEADLFEGGSSASYPVLVRLDAAGDLDLNFGVGGIVTPASHPFGGNIDTQAAAAHLDGFLFFGFCTACGPANAVGHFLYRTLADGSPDTAFDSDGWLALDRATLGQLSTVAVDPAGRILLAGDFIPMFGDPELRLHRRLASGGPDLSFSGDGTAIHSFTSVQWSPLAIAVDPVDGALVVALQRAGGVEIAAGSLVRFSAAGLFVAPFGQPILAYNDGTFVKELAIDGARRIFVAGSFDGAGAQAGGFLVARRLSTGGVDTTFSGDGVQRVEVDDVTNGWDQGLALTLSGGKPVAAGHSQTVTGGQRFALVRLTNALIFADGFELGTTAAW
ncbi:MAG: hypothetical protein ABIV06_09895 [Thermoanaerobaculia bacterium]